MYNPEQKKSYLAFLESTNASAERIDFAEGVLMKVESAESSAGSDVCGMEEEQASALIGKKRSNSDDNHFRFLWEIYSYVKWCAANNLCSISEWTNAVRNSVDFKTARDQFVANDLDLQIRLDKILTDEKKMTLDTMIRACAWLLYAGVDIESVCAVKSSDIDLDALTVRSDDTWYDISEYGARSIRFAAEADSYVRHHTASSRYRHSSEDMDIVRCKVDDYIFTDSVGRIDLGRISDVFNKKVRAFYDGKISKRKLTLRSISVSGFFHRMYEIELSGNDPFFSVDLRKYGRLIQEESQYRITKRQHEKIARPVQDTRLRLLEDYCRWKLAFLPQINIKTNTRHYQE